MKLDPAQLAALDAVLRLGSFDAAAHALGVTPPAISQRIKALEDRVGASLVIRAAPCRATEAGSRLARHASEVALLESALARDLGAAARPARLRLAVNADSLATWFIPALAEAEHLYDIAADDESHSADWLRRGEVSAAITVQARPVQGCDAAALGRMRYVATCSPAFHATHFADGATVEALSRAPMLQFNAKDRLQHDWVQDFAGASLSPPVHRLPSSEGFVTAALCGLGWGLNPVSLVKGHLASGALVQIAPDHPRDVALTWQVNRLVATALAPLTHAVRQAAKVALLP